MINCVFSIHDSCTKAFMHPFNAVNKALAVRMFGDAVKEEGHPFKCHPEHYRLFYLGTFDDMGAKFDLAPAPEFVIGGVSLEEAEPVQLEGTPEQVLRVLK